jgi:uncharacterized protein YjbI with pentapeptide repeats
LGAFLTWQQVQSGAEQVRVSQRQLEIGQEGQITERFTRAIDQLGSKSIDVRLGGIYALERIAKNSPQDQDAITDILSAYVRGHSPWKPTASQGQRLNTVDSEYSRKLSELRVLEVRAGDIQAILDVLGRRPTVTANSNRLNLERTDLRNADLRCRFFHTRPDQCSNLAYTDLNFSNLDRAALYGANLSASTFYTVRLEEADLRNANLRGTILDFAHLRRANLDYAKMGTLDEYLKGPQGVTLSSTRMNSIMQADLSNASLKGASLKNVLLWRTRLENANLEDADLTNADLTEVDLRGTKLKNAKLNGANLTGARASSDTIWPESFDWKAAGVLISS